MSAPYPPIADLVPHAPPMLMLDALVDWEPGRAACRMTVTDETPFVADGRVDAVMTMEYMAQAVAACLGHEAFREGVGVRVGMIIGVRSMTMSVAHIDVGAELDVHVQRVRGNELLSHFDCEVRCAGAQLASATMTLYHAEKPPGT